MNKSETEYLVIVVKTCEHLPNGRAARDGQTCRTCGFITEVQNWHGEPAHLARRLDLAAKSGGTR